MDVVDDNDSPLAIGATDKEGIWDIPSDEVELID